MSYKASSGFGETMIQKKATPSATSGMFYGFAMYME